MITEETKKMISERQLSRLKSKIKILVISLLILSIVFIPTAFIILFVIPNVSALYIYVILIAFIYVPIGGAIVITIDIFIWIFIHEKFKTQIAIRQNIFENKRGVLSGTIIANILCWLSSIIIDILILISPERFLDLKNLSSYIFISGIMLLAVFIFVLGINSKTLKKTSIISSLLLIFYTIMMIPHFREIYLRRLSMVLPFTFTVYSLLIIAIILIFYILNKATNLKSNYFILSYGWVLILTDIIVYVSVYFTAIRMQGYHVIFLFNNYLIILSVIFFVVSLLYFLFALLMKKEKILKTNLSHYNQELDT